ncbi:MAG: twin-arginine translocase TatA/TatE family subunit [Opitutales bacterium]|nr:twin-arginine translocase TatA/TatE family subunit [Opitutales bacterium]
MPGGTEWIVIFLAILLLFGAKRLPELARGLGKSIREFKKATSEVEDNIREAMKEEEVKKVEEQKSAPVKTEASAEKDKVE